VAHEGRDDLAEIDAAAPADRDDQVGVVLARGVGGGHREVGGQLGRHLGPESVREAQALELGEQVGDLRRAGEVGVDDHERPGALALGEPRYGRAHARPEQDLAGGTQYCEHQVPAPCSRPSCRS
jgi:hypothetical protein